MIENAGAEPDVDTTPAADALLDEKDPDLDLAVRGVLWSARQDGECDGGFRRN